MNRPSPLDRKALPGHLDAPAGPLCPQAPVLTVMELASRDARRRPLVLGDETPDESPELRAHLDKVRQHIHDERCPICLRWYRNATHAYLDALRQQLQPSERIPRRLPGGEDTLEYQLEAERPVAGSRTTKASLTWQRDARGWRCQLRLATLGQEGIVPLEGALLGLALRVENRPRPVRLRFRLEREAEMGLISPIRRVTIDHPDLIRQVRLRLLDSLE